MIMLNEVKAEITELTGNITFVRNLSLTFLVAIASLSFLADLQSRNTQLTEQASIIHSDSNKIIIERK